MKSAVLLLALCALVYKVTAVNEFPGWINDQCVFPFTYNGVVYEGCTKDSQTNSHDTPWCSHNAQYVTGDWSYCTEAKDPMHPYLIEYAKSMNYTMCYVGARDMTNGMLTGDSMTPSICEYPGSTCVMYTFTLTGYDGTITTGENGDCVPPMAESYYTCEATANFTAGLGVLSNCNTDFCEGDLCNAPSTESNTTCDWYTDENDLNFMPGMSMREWFHHMDQCTRKLYSGYPYQSKDMCRDNYDEAMSCLGHVMIKATNSPCMSMWDWLPGFRSQVNYARTFFFAMTMYDSEMIYDGIVEYYNIDKEMADYVKMYLDELSCPTPGKVPQCIEDAWKWAKESDIEKEIYAWMASMGIDMSMMGMDMNMMMGMMGDHSMDQHMVSMHSVCEEGYWLASMKASLDYMWGWYSAETREDTCNAVSTMFIRSMNAWDHMCDDRKVYPAMLAMFGEENRESVDVLAKMLMIWDDIYRSYEFPNCEASTMNKMLYGCEELYASETPCGKRKAWLCDYANWKMEFLSDWLAEFETFKVKNILSPIELDAPACDAFDMTNMCKHSEMQMCMTMPVTGCYTCFCADHEYNDLSGLSEIWRKDYLGWQHVFRTYKKAFGSATCREDSMKMHQMEDAMHHDDMHHDDMHHDYMHQ